MNKWKNYSIVIQLHYPAKRKITAKPNNNRISSIKNERKQQHNRQGILG